MIDYFALALGHGLMVIALLRLVMRDGLDVDPLIEQIKSDTADHRKASSASARRAARQAGADGAKAVDDAAENPALAEQR